MLLCMFMLQTCVDRGLEVDGCGPEGFERCFPCSVQMTSQVKSFVEITAGIKMILL